VGETEDERRVKVGIRKTESPWSWKMKEKKKKNDNRKQWMEKGMVYERENGRGNKRVCHTKRETKERKVNSEKKRRERKCKTAEKIN